MTRVDRDRRTQPRCAKPAGGAAAVVRAAIIAAHAIGFGQFAEAAPPPVGFDRTGCGTVGKVASPRAVSGGRLNVRSGPGRQYGQIARIAVGDTVRICTVSNEWSGILFGQNKAGWISSSFIARNAAQADTLPPPATADRSSEESKPAKPHPEWESAYARQTYRLGMTLSAFRGMPYPDAAENPGVSPVCSGDAVIKLGNYSDAELSSYAFEKAGVTKCVFFRKMEVSQAYSLALSVGLTLGEDPAPTEFFFMAPTRNEEPVLFWIRTSGPAGSFERLSRDLRKEYGTPASATTENWRNGGGSRIETPVLTWKNSASRIEFKRLGDRSDEFELEYTLTSVMNEMGRRLGLRSGATIDPL